MDTTVPKFTRKPGVEETPHSLRCGKGRRVRKPSAVCDHGFKVAMFASGFPTRNEFFAQTYKHAHFDPFRKSPLRNLLGVPGFSPHYREAQAVPLTRHMTSNSMARPPNERLGVSQQT